MEHEKKQLKTNIKNFPSMLQVAVEKSDSIGSMGMVSLSLNLQLKQLNVDK